MADESSVTLFVGSWDLPPRAPVIWQANRGSCSTFVFHFSFCSLYERGIYVASCDSLFFYMVCGFPYAGWEKIHAAYRRAAGGLCILNPSFHSNDFACTTFFMDGAPRRKQNYHGLLASGWIVAGCALLPCLQSHCFWKLDWSRLPARSTLGVQRTGDIRVFHEAIMVLSKAESVDLGFAVRRPFVVAAFDLLPCLWTKDFDVTELLHYVSGWLQFLLLDRHCVWRSALCVRDARVSINPLRRFDHICCASFTKANVLDSNRRSDCRAGARGLPSGNLVTRWIRVSFTDLSRTKRGIFETNQWTRRWWECADFAEVQQLLHPWIVLL